MTKENIVTVHYDELVEEIKERMLKTRFRSYPVLDKNDKVVGMMSRYHLLSRIRKQAILLDHNEKSQTADGIDEADIIEIIDHHRIGDIQTGNPILMKNEPVGSTATIIASLYNENKADMPSQIAGILLSAIISDTLNFKSPTSTERDAAMAKHLAAIADVNIDEMALKIFNAGSSIIGKSPDDIITGDLKEYNVGKYKIEIAQIYSTDYETLKGMQKIIIERMNYLSKENGLIMLLLIITDLNRNGSEIITVGDRKDVFFKAFSIEKEKNCFF